MDRETFDLYNLARNHWGEEEWLSEVETRIHDLLALFGDDPERAGLVETPARVARMYAEMLEGMVVSDLEIAEKFDKCFEEGISDDMVVIKNIEAFSFCEHHMALMYNMKVHVGYIPNGKVIGLSKVPRIVNMVTKRLQLQERIGKEVASILRHILNTENVIVVIESNHACMNARGVKNPAKTTTACVNGMFKTSSDLRKEFYSNIKE